MAKRKKYPKLPNGYGSIKYLGGKRRNPYAVHPPVTEFTIDGIPKTPKALCYVDDWMTGFAVLTAYKAGTYYPGMEKEFSPDKAENPSGLAQRILADYSRSKGIARAEQAKLTFSEVYEQYYEYKYVRD
ncbi:MAG: integrase, partial [Lachnospiraceae bacterium]|nr:integrase [Lachnospiraceae bacterium]